MAHEVAVLIIDAIGRAGGVVLQISLLFDTLHVYASVAFEVTVCRRTCGACREVRAYR